MTGNIIVSTCCLGDMAVNAPSSSGCALGIGGGGGGGAFTAISPSQTCANYYLGNTVHCTMPIYDVKKTCILVPPFLLSNCTAGNVVYTSAKEGLI